MSTPDFEQLGQEILDKKLNGDLSSFTSDSDISENSLSAAVSDLLNKLSKFANLPYGSSRLSDTDKGNILGSVYQLVDELKKDNKKPNVKINGMTPHFGAYKLICFAFLLVYGKNKSMLDVFYRFKEVLDLPPSSTENDIIDSIRELKESNNAFRNRIGSYDDKYSNSSSGGIYSLKSELKAQHEQVMSLQAECEKLRNEKLKTDSKLFNLENEYNIAKCQFASSNDERVRLEKENSQLAHTVNELTASIENSKNELLNAQSKSFINETHISQLKTQLSDLERKLTKSDANLAKQRAENLKLSDTINEQRTIIEDLSLNSTLGITTKVESSPKSTLPEVEGTNSDVVATESLNTLMDSFSLQIDSLNEELSEITTKKNDLVRLVHFLYKVCIEQNDYIIKMKQTKSQISPGKTTYQDNSASISDEFVKIIHETISIKLKEIIINPLTRDKQSQETICESFRTVCNILSDYEFQNCELAEENKKIEGKLKSQIQILFDNFSGAVKFIENIINTNDVQRSLLSKPTSADLRAHVLSSLVSTEEFIHNNCPDLVPDTTLFEALVSNDDIRVSRKLDSFHDIPPEIMSIIASCATANSVLRKYNTNALSQLDGALAETRKFRHEVQNATRLKQENDFLKQEIDDLKQKNLELKVNLENQQGNLNSQLMLKVSENHIYDALEENEMRFNEEVDHLNNKLKLKSRMIKDLKVELADVKSQYENQLAINDLSTEEKTHLSNEIMSLKKELSDAKVIIEEQKRTLHNQQTKLELKYEQQLLDLENVMRNNQQNYEEALELQRQNTIKEIANAKQKYKDKYKLIESTANERMNQNVDIKRRYELALTELRHKIDEMTKNEYSLMEKLAEKEKQIKEANQKVQSSQFEIRTASMKASASEEKLKRQHSQTVTALQLQISNLESKYKIDLEKAKDDASDKVLEIERLIHATFPDFDQSLPLTTLVPALAQQFRECRNKNSKLTYSEIELSRIRQVLSSENAYESVIKLNRENEQMKLEVENMKKVITEAKTVCSSDKMVKQWEDWAHKVHTLISCRPNPSMTSGQLRRALEVFLLSSNDNVKSTLIIDSLRQQKKYMDIVPHIKIIRPPENPGRICILTVISLVRIYRNSSIHSQASVAYKQPQRSYLYD